MPSRRIKKARGNVHELTASMSCAVWIYRPASLLVCSCVCVQADVKSRAVLENNMMRAIANLNKANCLSCVDAEHGEQVGGQECAPADSNTELCYLDLRARVPACLLLRIDLVDQNSNAAFGNDIRSMSTTESE